MGRAGRKGGERRWRRTLPSASLQEHSFFSAEETTKKPSIYPQGPALLDEEGEDSGEATRFADMVVGQAGKDLYDNLFQLLSLRSGKALVRCLENGEVFWTRADRALWSESVGYPAFSESELREWAKKHVFGGVEEAIWSFRDQGLWDMQLRVGQKKTTLLGNWILRESDNKKISARSFSRVELARAVARKEALNVEIMPSIENFRQRLHTGTLPGARDKTDVLRRLVWRALLGEASRRKASEALEQAARGQGAAESNELLHISLGILELDPLPAWGDDDFVSRVGPLWRRISEMRID